MSYVESTQTYLDDIRTTQTASGINSPFPNWPDPLRRGLTTEGPAVTLAVGFALVTLLAAAWVLIRRQG